MHDSDEALMLRAGGGDRAACELLVERHLGRIVAFAHRTLGNRSDAEDAAQDVFLRVWSAAPRWKRGSARFSTWLYRVAMNVCLDRIARKRESTADDLPELADLARRFARAVADVVDREGPATHATVSPGSAVQTPRRPGPGGPGHERRRAE